MLKITSVISGLAWGCLSQMVKRKKEMDLGLRNEARTTAVYFLLTTELWLPESKNISALAYICRSL
jgi:hypothetical protein